ncbi:MAG: hypothetical protein JRJ70_06720 [Deltaproteobacteria bacterium]|nr:hypothetical protein [Deltaproteobacteria bacterium]
MGKKKKDRSPESMLARAEKLFSRGNYPLAKKEFEKVLRGRFQPVGLPGRSKGPSGPESERMVERKDISERIEICNKEIKRLKAEDLIRRARKYSGNGNPREALRCFEGAYGISGEDWIREKIGRLRYCLSMISERLQEMLKLPANTLRRLSFTSRPLWPKKGRTSLSERPSALLRPKSIVKQFPFYKTLPCQIQGPCTTTVLP